MNIRSFDSSKDYNEVSSWWKKQEWPSLPLELLTTSGFIIEDETNKIAATWIFKTNCPIYIMEWTVGNPDINWQDRSAGIDLVTDAACKWAKSDGATQVFTMTRNERFINKLEKAGFQKTESGMTHLVRVL